MTRSLNFDQTSCQYGFVWADQESDVANCGFTVVRLSGLLIQNVILHNVYKFRNIPCLVLLQHRFDRSIPRFPTNAKESFRKGI